MKALIVASETETGQQLKEALMGWGYAVAAAGGGEEALKQWEEDPEIDFVLAPWRMTDMTGPELCRRFRDNAGERDTYVMLLTRRGTVHDRVGALEAGADDFVATPIESDDLRARMAVGERIVKRLRVMRRLARVDELTGLRNRRAFEEDLDRALVGAERHHEPLGLIVVDVDHFKSINDAFGHAVGDLALQHLTTHLRNSVRTSDVCYRIGGDDFGVILYRTDAPEVVANRVTAIVPELPLPETRTPLTMRISVGAVTKPPEQIISRQDLLRVAEASMHLDRQVGGTDRVLARTLVGQSLDDKLSILIAEDDPVSRRRLEATLTKRGYDVVCAENGLEAWEIIDSRQIRFLISDWIMPELDGLQLCHRIRTLNPPQYTYVILLTVRDRPEDVVAGLAAGADDYVTKPFEVDELLVRVRAGERVLRLEDELRDRVNELEQAAAHVRQLQGMLPICSYCKKIRDDQDYWQQTEDYLSEHSEATFSHGICPTCYEQHVKPELERLQRRKTDRDRERASASVC